MIIENPEALKSWLTAVLAPLCDADPAALAKYVLALARKDKAESELRTAMCDQLDVFLQQETKGFVDRLFVTLENKSYLQSNPEPPPPSAQGATAKEELHTSASVASVNGSIPPPASLLSSSTSVAPPSAAAVPENVARESRTSSSKQKTEQRSSGGGGKRRSWSPRSRSRSRDRGQQRQQRSRSPRDRSSRGGGGGSRTWDDRRSRRSPPVGSSSGGSSQRRSDQRDQRGGGGRRSRSPPRRSSRSPPRRRNQRPSSRSPPPTSSKGESSDKTTTAEVTGTAPPSVQSVVVAPAGAVAAGGGNKFRCRDYDEKGYCMRGDLCPYDHGNDPVVLEDVELSSMLNYNRPPPGTAAAAPPGVVAPPSAVVVVPPPHHHLRGPPPSLSQLPPSVGGEPYNPDAPGISWPPPPMVAGPAGIVPLRPMPPFGVHGGPPYHRGMPPVPVPSHAMRSHPMAHHQHHQHHHNHTQHRPQMRGGGGGGGHPPPMGLLGQAPPSSGGGGGVGRELISVPTAGMGIGGDDVGDLSAALSGGSNKRNVIEAGLDVDGHMIKRSHFDYNRLGHQLAPGSATGGAVGPDVGNQQQQQRRPAFDPTNCCLEVKKIPRGLNNISVLNNHFSKFGKIVNLQVSFGGDPEGALVTFSSHSEAQAAYRSTEAVLNNRFIKVFWHNKEQQQQGENQPPTSAGSKSLSVKDRLGGIIGGGQRVLGQSQMGGAPPGATVLDEAAMKEATEAKEKEREKAVAAIKRSQEILAAKEALKKKQEEQKREATKLQVDLQRRKQELLDKQLQQQRVLIERLEKNKSTMKAEERAAVMQTVRTLQETIEKLKRDLQQQPPASAPTTKKSASSVVGGQVQHQAATAAAAVPTAKSVEEARKAVLDTEIELYQKQMEGSDTTELQHRLQELNTLIHQAHRGQPSSRRAIASARMGLRGRGSRGAGASSRLTSRGRGRGGYYVAPHVSVDRRPTQLKVTGFEGHQQGDILAHFANFGEVVDYQVDEIVPSLTVRYKSRKDAEMALSQGKVNFNDAALHVVWHLPAKAGLLTHQASLKEGDDLLLGVSDELGHGDTALSADENEEEEDNQDMDDLLNYEEDEDDEVERSWRR